jgi:hypothetical protein
VPSGHANSREIHDVLTKLAAYPYHSEDQMDKQRRVEIQLTEAQKAQIRAATGKDAETVELTVEELEERIAPATRGVGPRIGPQV